MRILHLASGREWRGGQRQTWLLAKGLARRGDFTQTVITARNSELARRLALDHVPVRAVRWHMGVDLRAGLAARKAAAEFDLLHAHDGHAVALGAVVSRLAGIPFIATRRMARPLHRAGPWRRAARVIAISGAVREYLVAGGIEPSRISVIPPAVDLDSLRAVTPVSWPDLLRLNRDTTVVVAVSALTPEKGMDLLVEAAALLHRQYPSLHWVIAGDGPERSALERRAGALQVIPVVHFLGNFADPLPLIAGAAALVVPSREEGFGTVILDALGLGIPVIGAAVGGIPEALAAGGGNLVEPGNPQALAEAVGRMITSPANGPGQAEEGRSAASRFALPAMVDRVAALYRSVKESIETQ